MKACPEFAADLLSLADAETAPPDFDAARAAAVRQHVQGCPGCQAEFERLEASLQLAVAVWSADASATPATSRRDMAKLGTQAGRWLPITSACAACVALILGAVFWFRANDSLQAKNNAGTIHHAGTNPAGNNTTTAGTDERGVRPPRDPEQLAAELAALQDEIAEAQQLARLETAAGYLKDEPSLAPEYASAQRYLEERQTQRPGPQTN